MAANRFFDDLDGTFIEKITHVLGNLAPSARRIVAENYSNDCE